MQAFWPGTDLGSNCLASTGLAIHGLAAADPVRGARTPHPTPTRLAPGFFYAPFAQMQAFWPGTDLGSNCLASTGLAIHGLAAADPVRGARTPHPTPTRLAPGFFYAPFAQMQAFSRRGHKKTRCSTCIGLVWYGVWAMMDSNQRPPACKAGALNQLS